MQDVVQCMLINPDQWDLLGPSLLVKRYTKPEQIGSILLPSASQYAYDSSWTLWEVVKSNPIVDEWLGYTLIVDDILSTLRRLPPHVGWLSDSTEVFVMGMHDDLIRSVVRWKTNLCSGSA